MSIQRGIPRLSKSKFIAGFQCLKRLWNECYRADEIPEPDPSTQAVFDTGHEVGVLAQQLFPGGTLVAEDHEHPREALATTRKLVSDEFVPAIFEGAFSFDNILIRVDVLERLPSGRWGLVEVKSSSELKDYYVYDAAIQRYVLEGCGIKLAAVGIMHINKQYVYDGRELDLEKLFVIEDVTEQTAALMDSVAELLGKEREALRGANAPAIEPGRHCSNPYGCEWWEECRASKPEHWVLELPGIREPKLVELKHLGFEDIAEVPNSVRLSAVQRRVCNCVRSGRMFVGPELGTALESLEYPVYYLDFETIALAIPRYRGTQPYRATPFQWSMHVRHKDGRLVHREWLCDGDRDPARELAEALVEAAGDSGSVMCYTPYERTVIHELARRLPDLRAKLDAIDQRLWDLCNVVRNNLYHPDFHGSFSLKAVLPVLVTDMTYSNLAVQDGTMAGLGYIEMIAPETAPERKAELRRELLEYCSQDTLAMVRLHEKCIEFGSNALGSS